MTHFAGQMMEVAGPSPIAVVLACAGLLGFAAGLVAMIRRRGHR
jgi:hypothetical protein